VFTNNVSRDDDLDPNGAAFYVLNSSNISIANNDIHPKNTGIFSLGGNSDLRITGNRIEGGSGTGVFFQPTVRPATRNAVVAGNEISHFGEQSANPHLQGAGIALVTNLLLEASVEGVQVVDNVVHHNAVGVSMQLHNSGILVRGNTVTDNRAYGIRARMVPGAPATSVFPATFLHNTILRNGSPPFGEAVTNDADAFDANVTANTWVGNVCEHDWPVGQICGVNN